MVSSRAVTRPARAWARLALAALVFAAYVSGAPAQQAAPPPVEEIPPPVAAIVAAGTGVLVGPGAGEAPLAWIDTPAGTLVALAPIVGRLGGQLDTGALGASYSLTVGDFVVVLAPGSAALTRGTEIAALSQPPMVRDGALYVPVDFVERTYGEVLSIAATWDPAARRLELSRPAVRELPVEVSLVHVQGVTTIVLRLPDAVRYRIERRDDAVEVVPAGDRFLPSPERLPAGDPYVRSVRVEGGRARIELAPGVDSDDYALRDPFRIVIDLFPTREPVVETPIAPPATSPGRGGIRTVVVDPGHGGAETGAVGVAGTLEKDLTLALARALAERLRAELGLHVVLTRDDDVTLPLDARSALANQHKADLFLSIHLNSTVGARAHGAETYFLSLAASDDRAAELAAVENLTGADPASPGTSEFDLQLLLWDLAQSRHLAASQRLASLIQGELNVAQGLADRGVKQAPFRVLGGAAMPAVLVELGFLSNRDEEKRLRDPGYRAELAATLTRAVARFKTEQERSPASAARVVPGAAP